MLRSALAPIAGFAIIGILVVFTDQLFSLLSQGLNSVAAPARPYYTLRLLADCFFFLVGGYCCAVIASAAARRAALVLIVCGEVFAGAMVTAFWQSMPHWYSVAVLLIYPPAVWVGARLRTRGEPSAAST